MRPVHPGSSLRGGILSPLKHLHNLADDPAGPLAVLLLGLLGQVRVWDHVARPAPAALLADGLLAHDGLRPLHPLLVLQGGQPLHEALHQYREPDVDEVVDEVSVVVGPLYHRKSSTRSLTGISL